MNSEDFVYLDLRWTEDGWLEAIRLRLTGWLPEQLVVRGIKNGVLKQVRTQNQRHIALSVRGLALTEPGLHSFTTENFAQLAQVLRLRGYSKAWIEIANNDNVHCPEALLDPTYREKLLSFLSSNVITEVNKCFRPLGEPASMLQDT